MDIQKWYHISDSLVDNSSSEWFIGQKKDSSSILRIVRLESVKYLSYLDLLTWKSMQHITGSLHYQWWIESIVVIFRARNT